MNEPTMHDFLVAAMEEEVDFHLLSEVLLQCERKKMKDKKTEYSVFTFASDVSFDENGPDKVGIILWFDKERAQTLRDLLLSESAPDEDRG